MRRAAILLTAISSLPLAILAGRSIAITVEQFFDPCMEWNLSTGSGSLHSSTPKIAGNDPCASRRAATSETKTGAIIRLLLVGGGIIAAILTGHPGNRTVTAGARGYRSGHDVSGSDSTHVQFRRPAGSRERLIPSERACNESVSRDPENCRAGAGRNCWFGRAQRNRWGAAVLGDCRGAAPLLLWLLSVCCFFVTAVAWWPSADLTSPV